MVTTVCNVLGSGGGSGSSYKNIIDSGTGILAGGGSSVSVPVSNPDGLTFQFVPVVTGDGTVVNNIGEITVEYVSSTSVTVRNGGASGIPFKWTALVEV